MLCINYVQHISVTCETHNRKLHVCWTAEFMCTPGVGINKKYPVSNVSNY